MPSGIVNVNFGAFPGNPTASVAVTGQSGIASTSLVEAWLYPPGGTTDHSEDEHYVENFKVNVRALVAGTGFTIEVEKFEVDCQFQPIGSLVHGQWQFAWCWN